MKTPPILMSAPMVRSLLAGAKTQTRRIIKPQPQKLNAAEFQWKNGLCAMNWLEKQSPFGLRGERVWVREAWRAPKSLDDLSGTKIGEKAIDAGYRKPWSPIQFEADQSQVNDWVGFGVHPNTAVPGRYRPASPR